MMAVKIRIEPAVMDALKKSAKDNGISVNQDIANRLRASFGYYGYGENDYVQLNVRIPKAIRNAIVKEAKAKGISLNKCAAEFLASETIK